MSAQGDLQDPHNTYKSIVLETKGTGFARSLMARSSGFHQVALCYIVSLDALHDS